MKANLTYKSYQCAVPLCSNIGALPLEPCISKGTEHYSKLRFPNLLD